MWGLPTTVCVRDKQFSITNNGDFRMILDCFDTLEDEELSEDYRVLACLIIFYNDFVSENHNTVKIDSLEVLWTIQEYVPDLIKEMFKFMNCGQDDSVGAQQSVPLYSWKDDFILIITAINNVAKQEVRALEYLHWWTFFGYFLSIGESVFSTVVSIRNKMVKHKKLEKWEQEFHKTNPQYFIWRKSTVQDRETEKLIKQIWNKGDG